jgi:hypothetical protein
MNNPHAFKTNIFTGEHLDPIFQKALYLFLSIIKMSLLIY